MMLTHMRVLSARPPGPKSEFDQGDGDVYSQEWPDPSS
jgi:hypothetical protein